jgi:hypothetical protein
VTFNLTQPTRTTHISATARRVKRMPRRVLISAQGLMYISLVPVQADNDVQHGSEGSR